MARFRTGYSKCRTIMWVTKLRKSLRLPCGISRLLRLVQGQQPACSSLTALPPPPPITALETEHLGSTRTHLICRDPCAGSGEKVWEGTITCYRNSMEEEAAEQGDAAATWAFPRPHKKGSWQAGMSGWVTPTAVKRAYGRVGSNWDGYVKFLTLQRECWCLQKWSWGAFSLGPKELGWQAHACPRWVPAVMTHSQKWANHGVLAVIFILRYHLMWVPDSWGRERNTSSSQREAGLRNSSDLRCLGRPQSELRVSCPTPPTGDRSLAFQVSGVQTSRLQAQDPQALGRSL